MRDNKFRGKRIDNGEWVYGNLIGKDVIVGEIIEWDEDYFNTEYWWKAKPETVGQFIGNVDKHKKEIYEGDIIKYKELIPSENKIQKIIQGADFVYLEFVGKVVWDEEGASFDIDGGDHGYRGFGARGNVEFEVIGNIYENAELMNP